MAFDGPTPFDGDPAFMFLEEVEGQAPAKVRAALVRAFRATRGSEYVEVDEGVWAWAAAELVAVARGRAPRKAPPEPFLSAARALPDPEGLVRPALAALRVVADVERSETAALWEETGEGTLEEHLAPLRARLEAAPKAREPVSRAPKTPPTKRQRLKAGQVLRIPLDGRRSGFGQFLGEGFAFFDLRSSRALAPEEVVNAPVLFRTGQYGPDDGVTSGRWTILGAAPIPEPLRLPLATFKVGEYSGPGTGFYRYVQGVGTKVKSLTEIEDLEPAGVIYSPRHIEERLKKHFGGQGKDYTFRGLELRGDDLWHPIGWITPDWNGEAVELLRAYQRSRKPGGGSRRRAR